MERNRPSILASHARAVAHRLSIHREKHLILVLGVALMIQAGMFAYSMLSYADYEMPLSDHERCSWSQSIQELPTGTFATVRRPLWCGALYAVMSIKRVTQYDDSFFPPESREPVYIVWQSDGWRPAWATQISVQIPRAQVPQMDRRIIGAAVTGTRRYSEVLVLGWPFRAASLAVHVSFIDPSLAPKLQYGGRFFTLPISKVTTAHRPNELLGKFPVHFQLLGLLGNLLVWSALAAACICGSVFVSVCVRSRRGTCPVCHYQVSPAAPRCPECGFHWNRAGLKRRTQRAG